jgi:ubiquinone biosynthesis protein
MRIPQWDKRYRHLKRYRQIVGVLVKYGFGHILSRMRIFTFLKSGKKFLVREKREIKELAYAQRIRLAMEELGPAFVKFGQVLSMRPFLIPFELVMELAKLQDEVAPFPFPVVKEIAESELKAPLEELFEEFNPVSIASASLAQVHKAKTKDGDEVVVKVQRPGIKKIIDTDMEILKDLANLLVKYIPESEQYDPQGMVEELSRTFRREIDFKNEGRNIEIFAHNFKGDLTVKVPKVFWDKTTSHVLTMEYIHGIKVSNLAELEKAGLDRKIIARSAGKALFKQIFVDGFFHADPHPGNLFIMPGNVIAPLDFGMMGRLSETLMDELSDLLIAIVTWNPKGIVKIYQKAGIISEGTDFKTLETDLTEFLYRYHRIPLARIDIKSLINDAFDLIHRHKIKIQSELMLFGKALATYEEVGRMLDPQFDFVTEMIPYVKKLSRRKFRAKIIFRDIATALQDLRDLLVPLPFDLEIITEKLRKGELGFSLQHKGLEKFILEMERSSNRISFSLIIAALIVGSSLIMRLEMGPYLFGYPLLGIFGYVFAGILGIWLVIAILRSGRI